MDEPISKISIEIGASSDKAVAEIKKTADSLQRLKSVAGASFTANGLKNISFDADPAIKKVNNLIDLLKRITRFSIRGLATPFRDATTSVVSFSKGLNSAISGFMRIAKYRLIRAVIKEVVTAFRDGIQHLYDWSRAMRDASGGDFGRFANSMDDIATSLAYFKNSVGAAVAPLVNMLAPAINTVTNAVIALLNAINQLLARLRGQSSWTRATRNAKEYGDAVSGAGGAAKEALRYLAPFDELNVLPSQQSGGGGGGGLDDNVGGLFEEMEEFEDGIANFADHIRSAINAENWGQLGTILGEKVNEIVKKIPWSELGKALGEKINALFTTKYWTLKTINFTNIGSKIADFLNNALAEIKFEYVGAGIVRKFTALGDLIIGAVRTINWTQVGKSVGDFVRGAFNEASGWLEGLNFYDLGYGLVTKLSNLFGGIDFNSVVASVKRAVTDAFKAAGNFLDGVLDNLQEQLGVDLTFGIGDIVVEDKSTWTAADWIYHIAQAIAPVAGAVIGAIIGGGPGAILGGTLGIALSLLIQSIGDPKNESGWTAAKWQGAITGALLAVGGAAVGLYFFPGLKGVLLGASIGIAVALAIKSTSDPTNESGKDDKWWADKLAIVFAPIAGALIGLKVAGLGGLLAGLSIGLAISWFLDDLDDKIKADPDKKFTAADWAKMLIAVIGPVAGMKIGAAVGGAVGGAGGAAVGALIGLTVGLTISWSITHIDPIEDMGDAAYWIAKYGSDLPAVNVPVDVQFSSIDDLATHFKNQLDQYDFRLAEDLIIKVPVGIEPNVPEDLKSRLTKIVSDNEFDLYIPVDLLPNGWETPADWVRQQQTGNDTIEQPVRLKWDATGGGASSSGFFGHFRTNTVSYWAASQGGEIMNQPVSLKRQGWSVVSDLPHKYMGTTTAAPIELKKDGWDTVASWTKQTAQYGEAVDKSITLSSKMDSAYESNKKVSAFMSEWNGLTDKSVTVYVNVAGLSLLDSLLGMLSAVAGFFGVRYISAASVSTPKYATGGFPEDGIFMANHGELVGKFSNGRTAVANNDQIISGIERGVYNAVTAAMSNQNNSDREVRVYLDGKEISATTRRYERNINRATGVA